MAGSSYAKAVRAFVEPIQAALSCFVAGKVTADQYKPDHPGVLTFNRYVPVRLRGPGKIHVRIMMRYRIVAAEGAQGPWKVSTAGWIYHLLDGSKKDLIGYHWHPVSSSHLTTPHFHDFEHGDTRHFPTGRILIEDVLQLATEYGANPRDKVKWADTMAENREKFARGATWGHFQPNAEPDDDPSR